MRATFLIGGWLFLCLVAGWTNPATGQRADVPPPQAPHIAPASDEARQSLAAMQLDPTLRGSLFVAEPQVANIVAFYIDDQGRAYVCETFRQSQGVEDNRKHMDWLDDDLAAQTVEDRRAYILKHLGDAASAYSQHDDRLRLVEDLDGDRIADRSTVFAAGFNDIVDGTGAGVLAHQGRVYYTCIPHLWLLEDTDGDGQADERRSLHAGFGVRFAFRGHDMHGLIIGPDGRLYFSIGDRGYHVVTDQGVLADPESGAVFRCELDGSDLQVFATGLRNPQELAFDDYGNLFTADNNSDSGDKARWVYLVEGSDSGWRMAYQYLPDRGPFNREQIWHPYHPGQPAYIVPPVANLADGPSGLASYPGTGLDEKFRGCFFLCDFRGTRTTSGVRSFRVAPQGAFFQLVDQQQPIWNILATDVQFGPDGGLYLSDWVDGWNGEGKGRIYRFVDPQQQDTDIVSQVQQLLGDGLAGQSIARLSQLLAHPDRRVRMAAQLQLVDRAQQQPDLVVTTLLAVAHGAEHFPGASNETAWDFPPQHQLARLHACWALGHQLRKGTSFQSMQSVVELLADDSAEIRCAALELLGQSADGDQLTRILAGLSDPEPRVRSTAAMAVAHLAGYFQAAESPTVIASVLKLLTDNDNQDPIVRHSAVMALTAVGDENVLREAATEASAAARLGIVLALRRLRSAGLEPFLADSDPLVVEEAARAIHDLPVADALPALARMAEHVGASEPLLSRAINACYRLGTAAAADRLADVAASEQAPMEQRIEAVNMLASWEAPSQRDRVLGMWRPLEPRASEPARAALSRQLAPILSGPASLRQAATRAATALAIRDIVPTLRTMVVDPNEAPQQRADSLLALVQLKDEQSLLLAETALQDDTAQVRAAAREVLAKLDPARAVPVLLQAVEQGSVFEQQQALAMLARLPDPRIDRAFSNYLNQLAAGEFSPPAALDLMESAEARDNPSLQQQLQSYRESLAADDPAAALVHCLVGGDVHRGRQIFYENSTASCLRCHKIDDGGGEVGPDLSKIAEQKDRQYLLEAIVDPNKAIAKGFESVLVLDFDGVVHTGVIRHEDDQVLRIITAEGQVKTIAKDQIDVRREGRSAMPEDITKQLSPRQIRDLVEFLSQLK